MAYQDYVLGEKGASERWLAINKARTLPAPEKNAALKKVSDQIYSLNRGMTTKYVDQAKALLTAHQEKYQYIHENIYAVAYQDHALGEKGAKERWLAINAALSLAASPEKDAALKKVTKEIYALNNKMTIVEVDQAKALLAARKKVELNVTEKPSNNHQTPVVVDQAATPSDLQNTFQSTFTQLAKDPVSYQQLMAQSFGSNYDHNAAEKIRTAALAGDFSWLPETEVLSSPEFADGALDSRNTDTNVLLGAFDGQKILINQAVLSNTQKANQVYSEEAGHALDKIVNHSSDAKGDEGAIFQKLLLGENLTTDELNALKAENDHGTLGRQTAEFSLGSMLTGAWDATVNFVSNFITTPISNLYTSVSNFVHDNIVTPISNFINPSPTVTTYLHPDDTFTAPAILEAYDKGELAAVSFYRGDELIEEYTPNSPDWQSITMVGEDFLNGITDVDHSEHISLLHNPDFEFPELPTLAPAPGGNPPAPGGNPPAPGGNPPAPGGNPPVPGGNPPAPGGNPDLRDRIEAAITEISAWAENTGNKVEDGIYRAGAAATSSAQRNEFLREHGIVNTTEPSINFSDEYFKQTTGGQLTIEESQKLFLDQTGKEITRETIETLFTDPIKARDILMNEPSIHKEYRNILNENTPSTFNEAAINPDKWERLPWYQSIFHDAVNNIKFISKDGGYREVIFDKITGLPVDNVVEKGTFNFFDPNLYQTAHILTDVDPYVELGN